MSFLILNYYLTRVGINMKIRIIRDITPDECGWLDETIKSGGEYYIYHGPNYGCISPYGRAISEIDGETPFFEVPNDSFCRCE